MLRHESVLLIIHQFSKLCLLVLCQQLEFGLCLNFRFRLRLHGSFHQYI